MRLPSIYLDGTCDLRTISAAKLLGEYTKKTSSVAWANAYDRSREVCAADL